MNAIFKPFATEHFTYSSTLGADVMSTNMRRFCEDHSFFDNDVTIDGGIYGDNEFNFTKKGEWYKRRSTLSTPIVLRCKVLEAAHGCLVQVRLRPNWLKISGLLVAFEGLFLMVDVKDNDDVWVKTISMLIVPCVLLFSTASSKAYLLKNFIIQFDLKPSHP